METRSGTKLVCELLPDDKWALFEDYIIIVNPNHPVRIINVNTGKHVNFIWHG